MVVGTCRSSVVDCDGVATGVKADVISVPEGKDVENEKLGDVARGVCWGKGKVSNQDVRFACASALESKGFKSDAAG